MSDLDKNDLLPRMGTTRDGRTVEFCDAPVDVWFPNAEDCTTLHCGLSKAHRNDHVAIFGSESPPFITIEVRW